MDSRFFVPIATMLAGIGIFVVFAIAYAFAGKPNVRSPWLVPGLCLVAGGLIVCSGYS